MTFGNTPSGGAIEGKATFDIQFSADALEHHLLEMLVRRFEERVGISIELDVKKRVSGAIDNAIAGIVENVINREYQPVNQWGEKKGEKTTLANLVSQKATELLQEKGKFGTNRDNENVWAIDRYGVPLIQAVANRVVLNETRNKVHAVVEEERKNIAEKIEKAVAAALVENKKR